MPTWIVRRLKDKTDVPAAQILMSTPNRLTLATLGALIIISALYGLEYWILGLAGVLAVSGLHLGTLWWLGRPGPEVNAEPAVAAALARLELGALARQVTGGPARISVQRAGRAPAFVPLGWRPRLVLAEEVLLTSPSAVGRAIVAHELGHLDRLGRSGAALVAAAFAVPGLLGLACSAWPLAAGPAAVLIAGVGSLALVGATWLQRALEDRADRIAARLGLGSELAAFLNSTPDHGRGLAAHRSNAERIARLA